MCVYNLQGRMMSVLAKVPRESHESVEIWFKKRQKVGAGLARKVGLWSSIWCKRVCEWDSHVERSADRNTIISKVRAWRGEQWLIERRLEYVSNSVTGGRNRPDRGRLGTRVLGGKPQPRWHEGVNLAKQMNEINSVHSNSRLSVGSRIQMAHSYLMSFFYPA